MVSTWQTGRTAVESTTCYSLRERCESTNNVRVKLGRRHHFSITWAGAFGIPNSGQVYKKTRLRFFTDDYGEWETKYPGETTATHEFEYKRVR